MTTTTRTLADRINIWDVSDGSLRRYNITDADNGDKYLGWVAKFKDESEWVAYVTDDVNAFTRGKASQMARTYATKAIGRTRKEAVAEVVGWLEIFALYR